MKEMTKSHISTMLYGAHSTYNILYFCIIYLISVPGEVNFSSNDYTPIPDDLKLSIGKIYKYVKEAHDSTIVYTFNTAAK